MSNVGTLSATKLPQNASPAFGAVENTITDPESRPNPAVGDAVSCGS